MESNLCNGSDSKSVRDRIETVFSKLNDKEDICSDSPTSIYVDFEEVLPPQISFPVQPFHCLQGISLIQYNLRDDIEKGLRGFFDSVIGSRQIKTEDRSEYFNYRKKTLHLIERVIDFFGGLGENENIRNEFSKMLSRLSRETNILYLSDLKGVGLSVHRSILFKLLCERVNIPCQILQSFSAQSSDVDEKEHHMWNRVKIGSEFCDVDTMKTRDLIRIEEEQVKHNDNIVSSSSHVQVETRFLDPDPKSRKFLKWGSYGVVFLVQEDSLSSVSVQIGRSIGAVKSVNLTQICEEFEGVDCQKLLRREIDVLSQHCHPNILHIRGSFATKQNEDDNLNIIMDSYDCNADQFLSLFRDNYNNRDRLFLPAEEIMMIYLRLIRGLLFIHEHLQIFHFNLKLENILMKYSVMDEEKRKRVTVDKLVISDFGSNDIDKLRIAYAKNKETTEFYTHPELLEKIKKKEEDDNVNTCKDMYDIYSFGRVMERFEDLFEGSDDCIDGIFKQLVEIRKNFTLVSTSPNNNNKEEEETPSRYSLWKMYHLVYTSLMSRLESLKENEGKRREEEYEKMTKMSTKRERKILLLKKEVEELRVFEKKSMRQEEQILEMKNEMNEHEKKISYLRKEYNQSRIEYSKLIKKNERLAEEKKVLEEGKNSSRKYTKRITELKKKLKDERRLSNDLKKEKEKDLKKLRTLIECKDKLERQKGEIGRLERLNKKIMGQHGKMKVDWESRLERSEKEKQELKESLRVVNEREAQQMTKINELELEKKRGAWDKNNEKKMKKENEPIENKIEKAEDIDRVKVRERGREEKEESSASSDSDQSSEEEQTHGEETSSEEESGKSESSDEIFTTDGEEEDLKSPPPRRRTEEKEQQTEPPTTIPRPRRRQQQPNINKKLETLVTEKKILNKTIRLMKQQQKRMMDNSNRLIDKLRLRIASLEQDNKNMKKKKKNTKKFEEMISNWSQKVTRLQERLGEKEKHIKTIQSKKETEIQNLEIKMGQQEHLSKMRLEKQISTLKKMREEKDQLKIRFSNQKNNYRILMEQYQGMREKEELKKQREKILMLEESQIYDLSIHLNGLKNGTGGWNVVEYTTQVKKRKYNENLVPITICVLGFYGSGKTFVHSRLSNSIVDVQNPIVIKSKKETTGISLKSFQVKGHEEMLIEVIDTNGFFQTPYFYHHHQKKSNSSEPENNVIIDKKRDEEFMYRLCVRLSSCFVIVVNRLDFCQQLMIERVKEDIGKNNKSKKAVVVLYVIHNLKDTDSKEVMKKYYDDVILKTYDGEFLTTSVNQQNEIEYFQESSSNVITTRHFFLGREGSIAGLKNRKVFEYIRNTQVVSGVSDTKVVEDEGEIEEDDQFDDDGSVNNYFLNRCLKEMRFLIPKFVNFMDTIRFVPSKKFISNEQQQQVIGRIQYHTKRRQEEISYKWMPFFSDEILSSNNPEMLVLSYFNDRHEEDGLELSYDIFQEHLTYKILIDSPGIEYLERKKWEREKKQRSRIFHRMQLDDNKNEMKCYGIWMMSKKTRVIVIKIKRSSELFPSSSSDDDDEKKYTVHVRKTAGSGSWNHMFRVPEEVKLETLEVTVSNGVIRFQFEMWDDDDDEE